MDDLKGYLSSVEVAEVVGIEVEAAESDVAENDGVY